MAANKIRLYKLKSVGEVPIFVVLLYNILLFLLWDCDLISLDLAELEVVFCIILSLSALVSVHGGFQGLELQNRRVPTDIGWSYGTDLRLSVGQRRFGAIIVEVRSFLELKGESGARKDNEVLYK